MVEGKVDAVATPDYTQELKHNPWDIDVAQMFDSGINEAQILRLQPLRQKVILGESPEITIGQKRTAFIKALVERGDINDN